MVTRQEKFAPRERSHSELTDAEVQERGGIKDIKFDSTGGELMYRVVYNNGSESGSERSGYQVSGANLENVRRQMLRELLGQDRMAA